jgi:hypothetical protein
MPISLTQLAVILAGVWILLVGLAAFALDGGITIVFGIVIIVLVLLDGTHVIGAGRTRTVQ